MPRQSFPVTFRIRRVNSHWTDLSLKARPDTVPLRMGTCMEQIMNIVQKLTVRNCGMGRRRPVLCAIICVAFWMVLVNSSHAQTNFQIVKSFGFQALSTGAQPESQMVLGTDGRLYGVTSAGGSNGLGVVFGMNADGSGYQMLHSFAGGANDGSFPMAEMLQASDGKLYGTTEGGGSNNIGVVYRINTDGTGFGIVHSFYYTDGQSPQSGLLQAREDGMLYGTTASGGANAYGGTVFRVSLDGSSFQVVYNFTVQTGVGCYSGLLEGADGFLYGTTYSDGDGNNSGYNGALFKMARDGSTVQELHFFEYEPYDGDLANGRLIQGSDGYLYGTTENGGDPSTGIYSYYGNGTIYKIDTNGGGYQTYFFPTADATYGAQPFEGLHFGADGYLYGAASGGGTSNQGTLFKISTSLDAPIIIHDFIGADGDLPKAGIIPNAAGTNFYGLAFRGGSNGFGTAFQAAYDGSSFSVLHEFVSPTGGDGLNPQAPVSIYGNVLYGTTKSGAAGGYGAAFSMNLDGSGYQFLHSFTNSTSDGHYPLGCLLKALDGYLYGTTEEGGAFGYGTIFKVSTNGSFYSVLWNFANSPNDGAYPQAGLIQGADGFLYGTTSEGGTNYSGTVFSISTNGDSETLLHNFNGEPDGQSPYGSLWQDRYGILYGTTEDGGTNGYGTIFSMTTNGGNFLMLHNFNGATNDGQSPAAGLLQGLDGRLYGTTQYGGSNYSGTVFVVGTNGSGYAVLHSLESAADGGYPASQLVQGANGALYGTCNSEGANYDGTVFKLNPDGTGFLVLHTFSDQDCVYPEGGLALAPDGSLWGAADEGGALRSGAIFKLSGPTELVRALGYGANGFSFSFTGGVPNQNYQIFASPDLISWTSIATLTSDANGSFQYQDSSATGHSVRFYKTSGP